MGIFGRKKEEKEPEIFITPDSDTKELIQQQDGKTKKEIEEKFEERFGYKPTSYNPQEFATKTGGEVDLNDPDSSFTAINVKKENENEEDKD